MAVDITTLRQPGSRAGFRSAAGFSLPELLIAVTILLIISSAVTQGLLQLTSSQTTISNRTEMHSGVRSATELLQQEVGQAGRVALPSSATLGAAVTATAPASATVAITFTPTYSPWSPSPFFVGEFVVVDGGSNAETVAVTAVDTAGKTIAAAFTLPHAAGAAIHAYGGFASGIVPDQYYNGTAWVAYPNGSDGTHLKMFGDINGNGNMQYVEYFCDTTNGYLYRNAMNYDAASKSAPTQSQVLLNNIQANPGSVPCFKYMPSPHQYLSTLTDSGCACPQAFITDVAITLTVQTQLKDPITQQYQTETKALLNVSPRNVFDVWQLASNPAPLGAATNGNSDRLQPMPASVKNLLP